MEEYRFDALVRSWTHSRRAVVGGTLGLATLTLPGLGEAQKRRRRKRKHKKKKPMFNTFGCVNVGAYCQNSDQCCSGICEGKQGKKTCQAHHASTCQGQDGCVEAEVTDCTTSTGVDGSCFRTTGNASYCSDGFGLCMTCAEDADCVFIFGPQAACVICANCAAINNGEETACAGLGVLDD